jgi:hypothetical protein
MTTSRKPTVLVSLIVGFLLAAVLVLVTRVPSASTGDDAAQIACARFDAATVSVNAGFVGDMQAAHDEAVSASGAQWVDLRSGMADYATSYRAQSFRGIVDSLVRVDSACSTFRPAFPITIGN